MLFQTRSTDDGCHNKGTMLIKSFYLLLLSRTGLLIFLKNRSGFLSQAPVLIKDRQLYNSRREAEGKQTVKPAIIFRGKGNVSTEERDNYDKDIDVYFQQCAWAQNTLKNGLKGDPAEKVLFADNAGFQQAQNFHDVCRDFNTVVYLLTENHTDKVQPIDAGYGKMMNKKMDEQMEKWLEEEVP